MKHYIIMALAAIGLASAIACVARTNNDGTCDARYNANKAYISRNPHCRKR